MRYVWFELSIIFSNHFYFIFNCIALEIIDEGLGDQFVVINQTIVIEVFFPSQIAWVIFAITKWEMIIIVVCIVPLLYLNSFVLREFLFQVVGFISVFRVF